MFAFIIHIFTVAIYQPFLNLLVLIYWLILKIPGVPHDMGIAVIIFTLIVRLIMLPNSLKNHKKEVDRHQVMNKLEELEQMYSHDPIKYKEEYRKYMRSNSSLLSSEGIDLFIQTLIIIMCWRLFATGLEGADLHLLYHWLPNVPQPFNLVFINQFDLTQPNVTLNIMQASGIFILEGIHLITTPFPVSKSDVVRLEIFLPVVSYIYFSFMPSGKKLFMITTLAFSIVVVLARTLVEQVQKLFPKTVEVAEVEKTE